MARNLLFLLPFLLALSCGSKPEPAATKASAQSEPEKKDKPLGSGDDQPITVVGGSIGVLSTGEWLWTSVAQPMVYAPTKTDGVKSIMVFLTDPNSGTTDADAEAQITPVYSASDALKIEVFRKASPMADPIATLATDVQTGLNLKLTLKNPRRFKRFYFNGGNGLNISKIVFTNVKGDATALAKVGCTINTNKITCLDSKTTPAGLGFVIHTY